MVLAAFLAFLLIFLAIGVASYLRSRGTTADYYLASSAVHPSLVGLSAVATNNSGYMFIGVIGYTYTTGLPAIWLMFGWILGDFLASLAVHRELRHTTERTGSITFPAALARWTGVHHRTVRVAAALLTIVFLGAYAAAQLSAGGKALQSLFGWSPRVGAMLVAAVVALYCFAGGIRASIWTDAAQSVVMLVAMAVLLGAAVHGLGGPVASWQQLDAIPQYMDWFPQDLLIPGAAGMLLFVIGWLFAGLSVIGQPHILIRFMALDRPERLWHARAWYYGFFTIFYALATGVGLLSRIYLPELGAMDPELALPTMARELLPPVLVGLILAGIFAATMSTADSLVLACSASLTNDLTPTPVRSVAGTKVATLLVTLLALGIALAQTQSVFDLVILAWSTLASAFAPLLIVLARQHRPSEAHSLAMMVIGTATALLWRYAGLHDEVYEGLPGILAGLATFYVPIWLRLVAPTGQPAERPDDASRTLRTMTKSR
jgi:sodium/proline symporter